MTEMAPEQPIPEEGEPLYIKGGGHLRDGRFVVTGEIGNVKLTLEFDREDEEAYDTADILIQAFPEVVTRVCNAIMEQADASEEANRE